MKTEKAIFAAGCFWGVQASFDNVKGVKKTFAGYTGGRTQNPSYKDVCNDDTGHAEAVLVEFDPKVASYENLLKVFWSIHDPTQVNRQGPDTGTQYRSAIFCFNSEQKSAAEKSKKMEQKKRKKPISTEIAPAKDFYPAEEYHQKYLEKRGEKVCH